MNPSLQADLQQALSAVLADIQAAVADLRQALGDEREALDRADPAALNRAGDAKQALLQRLERLDAERRQLAREAGAPNAGQQAAWTQVLQVLHECQRANQRNGRLIGQRLRHVRQALSVLTGQRDEAGVYGPAGVLGHAYRSLPLAQA